MYRLFYSDYVLMIWCCLALIIRTEAKIAEQPHWSVNNIQFSKQQNIRPIFSKLHSRTPVFKISANFRRPFREETFNSDTIRDNDPFVAFNRASSSETDDILKVSPKILETARRNENVMNFLRQFLAERQMQRKFSTNLMSSFGSKVVNSFE
ncbi:MEMO1-like protein [Sarcoptes scabiei]|nr:MEMO1-like protein [Sarcoptes scabiei]